jgi:ketosteroid isomerase-like protein
MYHAIVRRKARRLFASLSEGEWRATIDDIAPDVHHTFPGVHPLGGERHSRAAMERWFERLERLYPDLNFEVHRVIAKGWPHDTTVAIEWSDCGEAADGEPYRNVGAHFIRLRWGKAVYIHAYLDTEVIAESCRRMAANGIQEAAAAPITD